MPITPKKIQPIISCVRTAGHASLAILLLLAAGALYVHYKMHHDITNVLPDKLYRSSEITPERLAHLAAEHGITTVVDLRHPELDDKDYPEGTTRRNIQASRQALVAKGIEHISIPSLQRPNAEMVASFLHALEDRADEPILIHCDHGIGRAGVYTAIYLMEFTGYGNERARRVVSRYYSPRLRGRKHFRADYNKGEWLMNYVPRRKK